MDLRTEFTDLLDLDAARDVTAARDRLDEILASDATDRVLVALPRRRHHRGVTIALVAAAVAAVIAGAVLHQQQSVTPKPLPPADRVEFGTWEPQPKALTPAQDAAADDRCGSGVVRVEEIRGRWISRVSTSDDPGEKSDRSCMFKLGSAASATSLGNGSSDKPEDDLPGDTWLSSQWRLWSEGNNGHATPVVLVTGVVRSSITALTMHATNGVSVPATIHDGFFTVSYPDEVSHHLSWTATLTDGRILELNDLGEPVADEKPVSTVGLPKAAKLSDSSKRLDSKCRREYDLPKGGSSPWRADRPYVWRSGKHYALAYVTANGRSFLCSDLGGSYGPMTPVTHDSVLSPQVAFGAGGKQMQEFGYLGRDVEALRVHFTDGGSRKATVTPGMYAFRHTDHNKITGYTATLKNGTKLHLGKDGDPTA